MTTNQGCKNKGIEKKVYKKPILSVYGDAKSLTRTNETECSSDGTFGDASKLSSSGGCSA